MANVRQAVEDDFLELVAMGKLMAEESPRFRDLGYSPDKCLMLLKQLTDHPRGLVLVAEQGGDLVGMVLAMVTEQFFSDELTASELVVYVRPESRGGSAAARMIKSLESWSFGLGVREVQLGVSTGIHADRTAEYYRRLGYEDAGYMLRKRCT